MRYKLTRNGDGSISLKIPAREVAFLAELQRRRDVYDKSHASWQQEAGTDDEAQNAATFIEVGVDGYIEDTEAWLKKITPERQP